MDNYALTRELWRMKKDMVNQTAEIKRLRNKFRRLKRFVWPLVNNFRIYVKEKNNLKRISLNQSRNPLSPRRDIRSHHLSNWGGIKKII